MRNVATDRIFLVLALLTYPGVSTDARAAEGVVRSQRGDTVGDAHVRVQVFDEDIGRYRLLDEPHVMSDDSGSFEIETNPAWEGPWVMAGRPGYLNYGAALNPTGETEVTIFELPEDDPSYQFVPPSTCAMCHTTLVEQWERSLHSNSARDEWVFQMSDAVDANGNPDGIGFRADLPDETPPCASCHAPGPASREPDVDLTKLPGLQRRGVECDFCHKVASVEVNDKPGVDGAVHMLRPGSEYWSALFGQETAAEDVLFAFGPYEDAGVGGPMLASFNPDMKVSAFCSGCHQHANELGVPNMTTYAEWETGPYAKAGVQCQDCHMVSGKLDSFVEGHMAGHEAARDPSVIYGHEFAGTTDAMLGSAALLDVSAAEEERELVVTANVMNGGAGHAFPTGMPIRNALLLVSAKDASGADLELVEGTRLPDYAGEGDPAEGNFEGLPGKGFARVLVDAEGRRSAWFWTATQEAEDTRIPPGGTDVTTYRFAKPEDGGDVTVSARLLYRRAYKPLADAKGWLEGVGDPETPHFRPYEVELATTSTTLAVAPLPPPSAETSSGCSCRLGAGASDRTALVIAALVLVAQLGRRVRRRR